MTSHPARTRRFAWVLLLCGAFSCRKPIEIGSNSASVQTDAAPAESVSAPDASTDAAACVPTRCKGRSRLCADCEDNDADGLVDGEDPDCFSPCDDTEDALSGGEMCPPGDCYFDPDCGGGNDDTCLALTPNGCDCYGCCNVPGTEGAVFLGTLNADSTPSCTGSSLGDPLACQPCTPDPTCFNACDACELCFAASGPGGECATEAGCSTPACDAERQPCGDCAGECATGEVCVSGCCAKP